MCDHRITIVCPSILPVPAVMGGAVETILDNFIQYNDKFGKVHIDLISIYEKRAKEQLCEYNHVKGWFIKERPLFIRINSVIKNLYMKKLPVLYYNRIAGKVKKIGNEKVLVEGGIDCAIELKKKLGNQYQIYYHSHGLEFDQIEKKELDIINTFSGIFFVSNFCLERAIKNDIHKNICHFLMNRIDMRKFSRCCSETEKEKFRKQYRIENGKKNIVFKGRIVEEKGILELIKAFNKLNDDSCCLLICGGRNFAHKYIFKSSYEKRVQEETKGNPNIKLLGYIPYGKIPLLDAITDLSIFPSRWDEPAGLVLIEAIVAQIPIVISVRGGALEYAKDAGVEFIDEDNFIDSLAEKMKKILADEKKQIEMKEKSKKVIRKFDFKDYYYELCQYIVQ